MCVCVFTGLDGVFANTCEPHILSFVPPVVLAHLDTHTHTHTHSLTTALFAENVQVSTDCLAVLASHHDVILSCLRVCVCVCVLKDYNQPPLCVFTCVSLFPTKSAVKAVAFILVSPVTWSCRTVTYCTIYVN